MAKRLRFFSRKQELRDLTRALAGPTSHGIDIHAASTRPANHPRPVCAAIARAAIGASAATSASSCSVGLRFSRK